MADSDQDFLSKETLGLPIFISSSSDHHVTANSSATNQPLLRSFTLPLLSTKHISRALDNLLIPSANVPEVASTSFNQNSLLSPLSPKRISQALDYAVASVEASLETIAKTAVSFLEAEQPHESRQARHSDLESGAYYSEQRFEGEGGAIEGWLD